MENQPIIYSYGLQHAIDDGVLVPLFVTRWDQLSGGKPMVVTAAVNEEISQAGLVEIWNGYVTWRREVMPTLSREEQMYTTDMNGRRLWVIEDGQAFTILYPEDY